MAVTHSMDLVADIGGTNARFALVDGANAGKILQEKSLPASEFASLQHAIEHYLQGVESSQAARSPLDKQVSRKRHAKQLRVQRAAIAVASPVGSDEIRLTNRAWSFSQRELQSALKLKQLRVLNDFGAVAHAVPHLGAHERVCLHGDADAPIDHGPISVLGPGTGLGVAMLVGSTSQGWQIVETEGGHISFAPIGDEEALINRWMQARFGRTSNERLLCGAGLSHIDAALSGAEHPTLADHAEAMREPADIVNAALDGFDVAARKTLARFCAVLGSVAGDTALIHGARSVMIAGGIVPRFIPFLRTSAFRERFLAKGRFAAYLEKVSIHVITHPNPGLLGAAVALRATP